MKRPLEFRLTEAEKGYIAGLVDGEGSILISRVPQSYTSKAGVTTIHVHLNLWLQIQMSKTECLDWLRERIPRSALHGAYTRKDRKDASPMYSWKVYGGGAVQILEEILPYLVLKRKQAELAIKFQSLKTMSPHIDPAKKAAGEAIRLEMRRLNRKGVHARTEIEEIRVLG